MKLILHIGTEKTGTTAFQLWLHENTQALRNQGIWVAQSLDLPNHRKISVMARDADKPEDGFRLYGIASPEDHVAFVDKTTAALKADVMAAKKAGMHTFIISSEHCHSRLRTQSMVNRTAVLLKPMFESIEVLVFLRPQVDTALSLASTGSRVGMYIGAHFMDRVSAENPYYNYAELLTRWAVAYGKWNVRPIAFKRNPNPIAYLVEKLELPTDAGLVEAKRINEKLDYRTVAFANLLVGKKQRLRPARDVPWVKRRFYIEGLPCETPLLLSRPDARALNKAFTATNRLVARDWLGITIEDLTPDFEKFPMVGNIDTLDTADISPILQEIVGRFNAEHAMAKARAEFLDSHLSQRDGDLPAAIQFMRTAIADLELATEVDATSAWAATQKDNFTRRLVELERQRDIGVAAPVSDSSAQHAAAATDSGSGSGSGSGSAAQTPSQTPEGPPKAGAAAQKSAVPVPAAEGNRAAAGKTGDAQSSGTAGVNTNRGPALPSTTGKAGPETAANSDVRRSSGLRSVLKGIVPRRN